MAVLHEFGRHWEGSAHLELLMLRAKMIVLDSEYNEPSHSIICISLPLYCVSYARQATACQLPAPLTRDGDHIFLFLFCNKSKHV
jgi:hypothetical protein